jgi:hypothetical protein
LPTVARICRSGGAEVTGSGAGLLTAGELSPSNAVKASVAAARTPITTAIAMRLDRAWARRRSARRRAAWRERGVAVAMSGP